MKFIVHEIAGLNPALIGMRYPMNSNHLSDSEKGKIGDKDMVLAKKLVLAGSEHAKFMRQIMVWVEISAPRFWWSEFDTYSFHTKNSESTMHTITKRKLTKNDFDGGIDIYDLLMLNDLIESINKEPSNIALFLKLKQKLPESFIQKRMVCTNYAELRNMYHQRKNHRLPHWKIDFVKFIQMLPNSELLTLDKSQKV